MGLIVTINCHSLSQITLGIRVVEVLCMENDFEFDGNNYNVVFHKEKVFAPQIC